MKNLLIYTGPNKKFSPEDLKLAKIQIDNSLDLGWKSEDMMLVTDFPWEYNGVKSLVVADDLYYDWDLNANKAKVIVYLLNQGMLKPDVLYWCHDFDAYENFAVSEGELSLENCDAAFSHYFYKPEWQLCSFFFEARAQDIFELLDETIQKRPWKSRNNEKTLTWLIKHHKIDPKRYKQLNPTYAMAKRYIPTIYKVAEKPLKVLHFRPSDPKDERMADSALNMFMYGKNSLKMPLMSQRLIKIFKYHHVR